MIKFRFRSELGLEWYLVLWCSSVSIQWRVMGGNVPSHLLVTWFKRKFVYPVLIFKKIFCSFVKNDIKYFGGCRFLSVFLKQYFY